MDEDTIRAKITSLQNEIAALEAQLPALRSRHNYRATSWFEPPAVTVTYNRIPPAIKAKPTFRMVE